MPDFGLARWSSRSRPSLWSIVRFWCRGICAISDAFRGCASKTGRGNQQRLQMRRGTLDLPQELRDPHGHEEFVAEKSAGGHRVELAHRLCPVEDSPRSPHPRHRRQSNGNNHGTDRLAVCHMRDGSGASPTHHVRAGHPRKEKWMPAGRSLVKKGLVARQLSPGSVAPGIGATALKPQENRWPAKKNTLCRN